MSWTVLTADHVLGELNNAEVEKYRGLVTDTQTDPLPGILSNTTNYVRGFVGKQVPLDAAGLPPEVVNPAVDIAIYRLCKRVQTDSAAQRKPAAAIGAAISLSVRREADVNPQVRPTSSKNR